MKFVPKITFVRHVCVPYKIIRSLAGGTLMAASGTEVGPEQVALARMREAWPKVVVGLALAINAIWIGFLGYWLAKLIV